MKKGATRMVSKRDIVLLVSFTILAKDEVEYQINYKHTKTTTYHLVRFRTFS